MAKSTNDFRKIVLANRVRIGSLLLIIIFSIVSLFYYSTYYPFLTTKLKWKDIKLENARLVDGGKVYSVDSGRLKVGSTERELQPERALPMARENDSVIRLAIFYQINAEDPLFDGPGFDIKAFEESLAALRENQGEFQNDLGLTEDIYPVEFMQKIIEVNSVNKQFGQNISIDNANKILRTEREAVAAYRAYAISLKSKLSKTKLPTGLFVQSGGTTSRDILLSDLQKTIENANALDGEIFARSGCLNYSTLFCQRRALKVFSDRSGYEASIPKHVVPSIGVVSSQPVIANGPYQIATPCFRQDSSSHETRLIYLLETHGGRDLVPQLADNMYFEKLSVEQFGEELYNQYREHGIEWIVATMNNGYSCNDMEYQAGVATINMYYKQFGEVPLFDGAGILTQRPDMQREIDEIMEFERIFAAETYPSEITMTRIAAGYAKIYNLIVNLENEKASGMGGIVAFKPELLLRFSFINNRLADFGRTLGHISYRTGSHARMAEVNPKGQVELDYVYFMRNNYSLTLGGFSPSIWRSKERLQYLDPSTTVNPNLKNYDEFVSDYGVETVGKVVSVARDLVVSELRAKAGL